MCAGESTDNGANPLSLKLRSLAQIRSVSTSSPFAEGPIHPSRRERVRREGGRDREGKIVGQEEGGQKERRERESHKGNHRAVVSSLLTCIFSQGSPVSTESPRRTLPALRAS